MSENFDAARLTLLLSELRLPATKQIWAAFAEQSDKRAGQPHDCSPPSPRTPRPPGPGTARWRSPPFRAP